MSLPVAPSRSSRDLPMRSSPRSPDGLTIQETLPVTVSRISVRVSLPVATSRFEIESVNWRSCVARGAQVESRVWRRTPEPEKTSDSCWWYSLVRGAEASSRPLATSATMRRPS